ncbi:MAG: hypothetical protein NMNS02_21800 [Nitrosomonas sp.]|nr:recombinase family protein [Nitrosomonas sp.]GJL76074.1 MAG: hypothetical protein NMNS02_21800 [Nitrosomonas sp.]
MQKVAIYARYSSDLQSDASIEDQIRVCSVRAKQEGWEIINTYTDQESAGQALCGPESRCLCKMPWQVSLMSYWLKDWIG